MRPGNLRWEGQESAPSSEPVFPAGQIEAGGCPGAFTDEFDLFLGVFPGEKRRRGADT